MTDTNPRDLIQRLAKELDTWLMAHHHGGVPPEIQHAATLVAEARAYLAQPELEGPTDRELVAVLKQAIKDFPPNHPDAKALDSLEYDIEIELRKARAVLARWGNHPGSPDSSNRPS